MSDLGVNEDMDVYIDDTSDLAFVEGKAAFEQQVQVHLKALYDEIINVMGESDRDTIRELLRVGATRAANNIEETNSVTDFDARPKEDEPDTFIVAIVFDTGENLEFEVTS